MRVRFHYLLTFSGTCFRDFCHIWREIRPTGSPRSSLHGAILRHRGGRGHARLQAHPSYSTETLPLDEKCTMARVIKTLLFSTHTRAYSAEKERALARSRIVMSTNAFRLERDALSPRVRILYVNASFFQHFAPPTKSIAMQSRPSRIVCALTSPTETQNNIKSLRMFLSRRPHLLDLPLT